MKTDIKIFQSLKIAGKIHGRIIFQVRLLLAISLIMLGVIIYEIIRYGLNPFISLGIGIVAFLFGFFVFSKMNKPEWDEEKEIIATARMDILAFVILALYIGFEIGFRTFLNAHFAGTIAATGYLLAGIAPSLFGRALGTLIAVSKLAQGKDFTG